MRLLEVEIPVQLEMQLDQDIRSGPPRAQIVHVACFGVAKSEAALDVQLERSTLISRGAPG